MSKYCISLRRMSGLAQQHDGIVVDGQSTTSTATQARKPGP
jgi:hypothetical protein